MKPWQKMLDKHPGATWELLGLPSPIRFSTRYRGDGFRAEWEYPAKFMWVFRITKTVSLIQSEGLWETCLDAYGSLGGMLESIEYHKNQDQALDRVRRTIGATP